MLYPKPCYNEPCYKAVVMYTAMLFARMHTHPLPQATLDKAVFDFKVTGMGSMISKEIKKKYNLFYGEVRIYLSLLKDP